MFVVPEKATQAYAALGVGFICITLGVPIWWKTTEIYRVQLPYSSIAELGQKQVIYQGWIKNFHVGGWFYKRGDHFKREVYLPC